MHYCVAHITTNFPLKKPDGGERETRKTSKIGLNGPHINPETARVGRRHTLDGPPYDLYAGLLGWRQQVKGNRKDQVNHQYQHPDKPVRAAAVGH